MSDYLYPLPPERVYAEKIMPSQEFRKQVTKVIIAILLFLLHYIALLAGGGGTGHCLLLCGCLDSDKFSQTDHAGPRWRINSRWHFPYYTSW